MIYITQLIYVIPGQEKVFHEFENVAIPIIKKHNGELLLRIRPRQEEIIEGNMETPYEIHIVTFACESDFESFKKDEERKQFLHLKEKSIKSTLTVKGMGI